MAPATTRPSGQDGFTIIEVIAATVVLLVGVLGLLPILQNSLASTSHTTSREQATNLARDLVERARQIPYTTSAPATVAAAIAARLPEAPAVSGAAFTVTRRNTVYAVTVTSCSIDDPADGAGVGTGFCDASAPVATPGTPGVGGIIIGPSVLGIALPVGAVVSGGLVQTVCNAVGLNPTTLSSITTIGGTNLLGPVSNGGQLNTCPNPSAGSIAFDTQPDDLRRVIVDVAWNRAGRPGAVTQTTLLSTPTGTTGPTGP